MINKEKTLETWMNRMIEYNNDKILAEKCDLEIKDICMHETDYSRIEATNAGTGTILSTCYKCKKCGEFYK